MSKNYCLHRNKTYLLNITNNVLELTSNDIRDINIGFKEYIDVLGNKHRNILVKKVDMDEIEFAYELKYKVMYKGLEFEPWAIGRFILENNSLSLFTQDTKIANQYNFIKKEQFVFKKDILLDEVDALIEIKKPILKFKYLDEVILSIKKEDIVDYLNKVYF
ncbi:hypothetical protein [Vallitalea guaymasensis]|uniref:Uncharacterized protein n=1 Tax=Vallitalea guaymasensis TaxID=1185412 RepID=A0A8J8SD39_9FIRM|nr:hypothetical protein [Vallitalea guaymasensis]QUH30055.1 hypothetical protein HYG85_14480 [Vallitalea guaymasensis]